jgi:hypothetical protein
LKGKEETPVTITLNPATAEKREYQDHCFTGEISETVYTVRQDDFVFHWRIGVLAGGRGIRLGASFENRSVQPVRLKEFVLLEGETVWEGAGQEWWLSTLNGELRLGTLGERLQSLNEQTVEMWKGFKMPVPEGALVDDEKHNDGRYRSYSDFLTLYRKEGEQGVVFGAAGAPEADIRYDLWVDAASFKLSVISDMTEILLAPGQTRNAQETVILTGSSREIETLIRWNAAFLGARTCKKPLVGWCSWYYYASRITEETVMATIKGFQNVKDKVPVDVIQIDDGFQKQVGDWGCNEKFPSGFGPWIEGIRAAGAMPGIWLAPLAVHESTGIVEKHPDWFQKDRHGTIMGDAYNWGARSRWLDPSHPGAQEFMRNIIRQKRAEGFTYFKIDFNTLDSNCRYTDASKTRLQIYRDLYALYREELGEDCYLLSCSGMTRGTVGYADASRVGTDSCDAWVNAHPCSISNALRHIGMNAVVNGIFYVNDPDVTYLSSENPRQERRLSEDERRVWHSFVGLLGGLQLTSDPIEEEPYASNMRQLEILSPPAPEKGQPLCPAAERDHRRFGFTAKRPWGNFASLLLWNNQDSPAGLGLPRKEFGPSGTLGVLGTRFHVWSFWDDSYRGISGPDYTTGTLPSHGLQLLRLTACGTDSSLPLLVGSNLHISMGAAEIADLLSHKDGITIRLNPGAGAGEGALYIYSPKPLRSEGGEGLNVTGIKECGDHVYVVSISGRDRKAVSQELRLAF